MSLRVGMRETMPPREQSKPFHIRFDPVGKRARCTQPTTVMGAARQAGAGLLSLCGGLGACGRCRVRLQQGEASPLSETEAKVLSADEIAQGYRLACRALVRSDVQVYIPPLSRAQELRLQVIGDERPVELAPPVRKLCVEWPPATAQDTRSNWTRLEDVLLAQHAVRLDAPDPAVLRHVGPALKAGGWRATLALRGCELVHIEPGDTTQRLHGIAVDLGSTKIAVYLVDLATGRVVEAQGAPNPQVAYGEDVISRINYAMLHSEGTRQLQGAAVQAINAVVSALCAAHGLETSEVLEYTLVGNTAMHHLFLGLPTAQLALAPYVASVVRPLEIKAREVNLAAAPGAYVYLPPAVAGFVGSDHVAMLLASWLEEQGTFLRVDIGTNTEMSLAHVGRIRAVSCASGPAFEGAHIGCGIKAAPGAIERVWIDPSSGDIRLTTIDDAPPIGLCGSGILDCVAAMRRAGMLNARGAIQPGHPRIRKGSAGAQELVLAASDNGPEVTVTQHDIERIQLAKGAIRSGIEVLLDAAGIAYHDIDSVILAGAFGTYIDPLSAIEIGMFPSIPVDRIHQVGNAAGVGAKQMLVSTLLRKKALDLAPRIEYLELTVYPRYSRFFAHALRF